MGRVEVILSETEQAEAVGPDLRSLGEKAVLETLRLEARRLAELTGRNVADGGDATALEVSLTLTDDKTIRTLNQKYLGRDRATDVLAFSMDADENDGGVEPYLLGDVVVSVETARRQAADWDCPYPEELARLVAHGTLHLLGYTDYSPEAKTAMHAKEDAVLTTLGFNPGTPS